MSRRKRRLRLNWFSYTGPLRWIATSTLMVAAAVACEPLRGCFIGWFIGSTWLLFRQIRRIHKDYTLMSSGVITPGIVKSYYVPSRLQAYDCGAAALWVAFAVGPENNRRIVSAHYFAVNPFRRWKPDDDITVIYESKTGAAVVVEAAPWSIVEEGARVVGQAN